MEDLKSRALEIENLVKYEKDSVVSREVIKKELGTVTFLIKDRDCLNIPLLSMQWFKSLMVKRKSLFPV